jgi:flagellar biosynthesis/type III secretory pathway chaperone
MLNWRRDPDYEQRKMLSELRIKQIDERTKQIENETEQLRQENARGRQLLASIDALCFPPDSRPSSL